MERRTKIVATIGPASRDPEVLPRMIEAGMDVARLNFSHGSADEHAETARSSAVPCEKFRRATSIPASTILARTSGSREAGPIVATIFVRRSMGVRNLAGRGSDGVSGG